VLEYFATACIQDASNSEVVSDFLLLLAGPILPPMDKNQVLIYLNAIVHTKSTALTLTMQFLKHMTAFSYN